MRNPLAYAFAITSVLLFSISMSNAADHDERLVGEWKGQRDAESKCSFLAWKLIRSSDGTFEIAFYADPKRTTEVSHERGIWWVKANEYFAQTDGVPTPDVYTFSFLDKDTVRYTLQKLDPSADCKADYVFTDHRADSN